MVTPGFPDGNKSERLNSLPCVTQQWWSKGRNSGQSGSKVTACNHHGYKITSRSEVSTSSSHA